MKGNESASDTQSTYNIGAHCVAGSERQQVRHRVHVLVLDHTRRVRGQAFRVDHAVEVLTLERDHDVVGVALDVDRMFRHGFDYDFVRDVLWL